MSTKIRLKDQDINNGRNASPRPQKTSSQPLSTCSPCRAAAATAVVSPLRFPGGPVTRSTSAEVGKGKAIASL